jgi:hypothetical protein
MAGVRPIATYTLYNKDRVKLEHLLARFWHLADIGLPSEMPAFGVKEDIGGHGAITTKILILMMGPTG